MPSGSNPTSQRLSTPYFYERSGVDEKKSLDSPEPGLSVTNAKGDFWRPHSAFSLGHMLAIVVLTVLPWVFYGVVHHKGSVEMPIAPANFVRKHPQDTDFFVTALASAIAWLVGHLFSTSVTTLSRQQVVFEETDIFHISFFSALKNRAFVWRVGTLPLLFKSWVRMRLVLAVVVYTVVFILITPGITALLHPQTFSHQSNLTTTEPDLSSSNPDCVAWYRTFNNLFLSPACGWTAYNDFEFTTCIAGADQVVDAISLARSNVLYSLFSNAAEGFTFSQLGGIHSVGPIQGAVPIGPNGIPAFWNLSTWPSAASAIPNSYNYTLNLQGVTSNVSCAYSSESIISLHPFSSLPNWSAFNATCPPGKDILDNPIYLVPFLPAISNNSLGFWACLTSEPDDLQESYEIYLYGLPQGYGNMTGNITCSVPAMQSEVFPVRYMTQTNAFNLEYPLSVSANLSTALTRNAIIAIGNIIWGVQQLEANSFAEAVMDFGARDYHFTSNEGDDRYPKLYAAMIQGLLEYEATYLRLLVSTDFGTTLAPSVCMRNVTGWVEYPVIGWQFRLTTAAYLIPLTIVNLTSLLFFLITMITVKMLPSFDPTDPVELVVAASGRELHTAMQPARDPAAWRYRLRHERRGRFALVPPGGEEIYGNENTFYLALSADG